MIRMPMFTIACLLATGAPVWGQGREAAPADQQPPIQARPGGPELSPRTDQTIDVAKGSRLVLSNSAGEVTVRSWDRDQIRVQATHSEREQIDVQTADSTVRVRARATRGPASLVDYAITVPRWMAVNLTGTYLEATIEGTAAEVTVETVNGNIRVTGGSGNVSLRSVQGTINVDKASGRVQAVTVNEGIRLTNVTGDMTAETTNGDIVIDNAQTSSLTASTVNGDITFNGTVRDNGSYRLTTHGGDIRVGLGGANSAIVFVRTFQGDFSADFPIQLPEGQTARRGSKRFNFTLGGGSARIELQSFNGDIVLAKGRVVTPEELREMRRKGIKPGKDLALAGGGALHTNAPAWERFGEKMGIEIGEHFEHHFDFQFDHRFDFDSTLIELGLDLDIQPMIAPAPVVDPLVVPVVAPFINPVVPPIVIRPLQ